MLDTNTIVRLGGEGGMKLTQKQAQDILLQLYTDAASANISD